VVAPPAPSASPSVRALEELEAQPEGEPDTFITCEDEDKRDWVPYTDFLTPSPVSSGLQGRGASSSRRRRSKGKGRASYLPTSPSASTSLLLPTEPPPANGLPGDEGGQPYLPSDASADLADLVDAPILVIRPLSFLSRCLGIGIHARPPPEAAGTRFSEWEAFWHGTGAGSRRELLGLGMR
jgi:hypothetical protein